MCTHGKVFVLMHSAFLTLTVILHCRDNLAVACRDHLMFLVAFQIDSSAIVEMEVIDSDESDYEVDFSGDRSDFPPTGM